VSALIGFTRDADEDMRVSATYSLARLRAPAAAPALLEALSDRNPQIRGFVSRALSKAYADSAKLSGESVTGLLARNLGDADPGVRIQAIRALATYGLSSATPKVTALISDPGPGVGIEAATALGRMPDPKVASELTRAVTGKGSFALRRAALLSLAKVDSAAFAAAEATWRASADWRDRAAAAEAWGSARPGSHPEFLQDKDSRVVTAALQAWGDAVEGPDSAFVLACRRLLSSRDAAVRSLAADGLARSAAESDAPALILAYDRAEHDSFPEARLSSLAALLAISKGSDASGKAVERQLFGTVTRPDNYMVRRWAEENWPAAAAHWGPAYPIETGRTLEDYRGIARSYILGPDAQRQPHVKIEMDQRGVIELQLFGPDAPLTVANFLRLVDRGFFNGLRWHRVVPAFVVQAGDPRGDGWGGPGGAIRDEINRHRYAGNTLGMALSGPDTGESQWFITLSQQPHLDGIYTVFGAVVDGFEVLSRITQGDLIRSIHR
jgi:cyclophilin family peptidyl-prolyl cis-trans isomerase/HEAT repeat protein